jgi:hypothetical protein
MQQAGGHLVAVLQPSGRQDALQPMQPVQTATKSTDFGGGLGEPDPMAGQATVPEMVAGEDQQLFLVAGWTPSSSNGIL